MTLWLRYLLVVGVVLVLFVGTIHAADTQPKVLTITLTDDGKTIPAILHQKVTLSLQGDQTGAGWEADLPQGRSLLPLTEGGAINDFKIPALEFSPAKPDSEDIGTYCFRYQAAAPGSTTLNFSYLSPGGSKPTERTATQLLRKFAVTVDVAP